MDGFSKGLEEKKINGRIYHSCTLQGLAQLLNCYNDEDVCFSTEESTKLFGRKIVVVMEPKGRSGMYVGYDADSGKNHGYDEFRTDFRSDEIEKIVASDSLMDVWENDKSEETEELEVMYELACDFGLKYYRDETKNQFFNVN